MDLEIVISFKNTSVLLIFYYFPVSVFVLSISGYDLKILNMTYFDFKGTTFFA